MQNSRENLQSTIEELETAIADGRMRNSLSLLALGRVFDLRGIDLS